MERFASSRTETNGDSLQVRPARGPQFPVWDYERWLEDEEVDRLQRERDAEFKHQCDFWE